MPFTIDPPQIPVSSTTAVLDLNGSGTAWSNPTYTITGFGSPTIVGAAVTATRGIVAVTVGTAPGIYTISDGSLSAKLIVTPANMVGLINDNFQRANTAAGGVANGWNDPDNLYSVSSNQLVTSAAAFSFNQRLIYPFAFTDGEVWAKWGTGWTATDVAVHLGLRAQSPTTDSSNHIYGFCFANSAYSGRWGIGFYVSGSFNAMATGSIGGSSPTSGWIRLSVSGTTVIGQLYSADRATLLDTLTADGFGLIGSGFPTTAGSAFVGVIALSSATGFKVSEVDVFGTTSISLNPTSTTGTGNVTVTVTGTDAHLATFTATGTDGISIVSTTINNANSATLVISPGSQGGVAAITDTVSGARASFQVFRSTPAPTVRPGSGNINVVLLGDSTTAGVGYGEPVTAMKAYIESQGHTCTLTNRGVPGITTTDMVNSTNGANLANDIIAAKAAGAKIAWITLGTNNPRTPYGFDASAFLSDMTYITSQLNANGIIAIINLPYWTAAPKYLISTAIWPADSDVQYQRYIAAAAALANGRTIFVNNSYAFDFIQANPSDLADSIHANSTGNDAVGTIWGKELLALPIQQNHVWAPETFPTTVFSGADSINVFGNIYGTNVWG